MEYRVFSPDFYAAAKRHAHERMEKQLSEIEEEEFRKIARSRGYERTLKAVNYGEERGDISCSNCEFYGFVELFEYGRPAYVNSCPYCGAKFVKPKAGERE